VAGDKVTDDIRKGLGVMRDQAEQLKRQFGVALADEADTGEKIEIPGIGGRDEKTIGRDALAQIIQPRMEEILEIAAMEIKRSGYGRHLGVGCVLTGGGSLIPETDALAAEVLGMEARVGRPVGLSGGLVEEVSDPKYSTGVGLVLYGMRHDIIGGTTLSEEVRANANGAARDETLMTRIANRMKAWFDEL
jgi:cell division protein FtsA